MLAADRNWQSEGQAGDGDHREIASGQQRFTVEAKRQRPKDREGEQFSGSDPGALPEEIRRQLRERAIDGVTPADCDHEFRDESEHHVTIAQSDWRVLNPRPRVQSH